MLSDRTQPKTAFVFAGGGSFGAVQVGMLHSLVCHGLSADGVGGSSVGAMNGAYYAARQRLRGSRLSLGSGEVCEARTFFQSDGETGSGSCDGGVFLWGRKGFFGSSR